MPGIAEGGRAYIQQEKFFQDFFWWNFSQDFLCAALCGVTVPMRAYDPKLDFAIASPAGGRTTFSDLVEQRGAVSLPRRPERRPDKLKRPGLPATLPFTIIGRSPQGAE